MRLILSTIFTVLIAFGGEPVALNDMFAKSEKCVACHSHIVTEWKSSWHAKSHYSNDEYFQKTIEYMARKMRTKSIDTLKVECASCHNPRISVTKTSVDDEIAAVMGLNKGSKLHMATTNDNLNEGINCAVCHNIDTIHKNPDPTVRGIHLVEWMKAGKMSGPYDNAHSPYHKTEKRDFMSDDPNKLCFVCHANNRSVAGHVFSNTEEEYSKQKNAKLCVDCHMSEKEEGIASNLPIDNNEPRLRKVRKHGFQGAHSPELIKGALTLSLSLSNKKLQVRLDNPNPHNVPTGYGGREIGIDIQFLGDKSYRLKTLSLTSQFLNKRKKKSVPHCATVVTKNEFVPAMGKKVYALNIPKGAKSVNVKVYFSLVNKEIIKILKLKEDIWSKKMFVAQKWIDLK